jgi:hypothetical protein
MSKREIKFYFLLIYIFINITSCEHELIVIPDTGRRLVINGLVSTDSVLNVHIGRSAYTNDNLHSAAEDDLDSVTVKFYLNNNQIDSLDHISHSFDVWRVFNPGNYRSNSVFPQSGGVYKVVAKLPDLPEASATLIIPDLVKILKVDTLSVLDADNNVEIRCIIEFNDPANETNFYIVDVREMKKINIYGLNNNLSFSCNDPIVEEKLFTGENTEGIAFSDKLINGQKCVIPIIIDRQKIGALANDNQQIVCFRLFSINKDYFNYIHDLNLFNRKLGNPFSNPVIVNSNVTGGYGMISGASVSSYPVSFQNK